MTHRQRVQAALQRKEPDRIPLDLWGCDSRLVDGLYFKILEHLGWDERGTLERPGKTAQYVDYRLSDLFDIDFRHLTAGKPGNFEKYYDDDGNVYDEWGIGYKLINECWSITRHTFAEPDMSALKKHKWPVVQDPGRIEGLAELARDWHENTDYAITTTTPVSGVIMDIYHYLRGTEQFCTDLYMHPKFAHALIEKIADIVTELYVYFITPVAPYLTWVEFASDFGTQAGAFMSDEMYREFLLKPMARIFDAVRKTAPQAKIFLHSCGSVRSLIPAFIDTGVDILSGLQPMARDMDSALLKQEFGRDILFHGGIDLQQALTGTKAQTIAETKLRIADYGPGGGYILSPSNHLTSDVSVENFFAMYETALECGVYPL
ncbi:MAG: hypothetical protein HN350_14520 [Phycisphaerales bacterium]|jgi:uroporphyrinogen decarboxylase|nr:hypothetical protein [Phycisphaerales bacterium]